MRSTPTKCQPIKRTTPGTRKTTPGAKTQARTNVLGNCVPPELQACDWQIFCMPQHRGGSRGPYLSQRHVQAIPRMRRGGTLSCSRRQKWKNGKPMQHARSVARCQHDTLSAVLRSAVQCSEYGCTSGVLTTPVVSCA